MPFIFTMSTEGASLLMVGEGGVLSANTLTTIWTFGTGCLAVAALAVAFGGWLIREANMAERVLMGVGGLALLYASQMTDLIGFVLVLAAAGLHFFRVRRPPEALAVAGS